MYVITGATGQTGNKVAEKLLAQGEGVRVVGRDGERSQPLLDFQIIEKVVYDVKIARRRHLNEYARYRTLWKVARQVNHGGHRGHRGNQLLSVLCVLRGY